MLQKKKEIVIKIKKMFANAVSVFVINLSDIKSNEINVLRKLGRENKICIYVSRNILMSLAIKNTNFECLQNKLTGSNLFACSTSHPGIIARLFKTLTKNNLDIKIKTAVFEKKILSSAEIEYFASLPTYTEAIANLIFVMKETSIGKLIRTVNMLIYKK